MPKEKFNFKYKPYPTPDEMRTGIKVGWYYFKDKAKAKQCAEAAKHNAAIQLELGYDFGYMSPGTIELEQKFYPGLYEVCIP